MRPGAGRPGGESWASLWHEEGGGGKAVAGRQAGGLPPQLRARPPGLWGLEEEGVQAQCCPWVRARVLCRHCLPRRQPGVPPLCFVAETRPSPTKDPLHRSSAGAALSPPPPHSCSREFCRTGVRCEVAGLGVGSGSVVESRTVSFARRYLGFKGHHRWRSGESACRCRRRIGSLSWEDPLEEEMAVHSSILAWRIPWREEPGGLQSLGLQRVRSEARGHRHTTESWGGGSASLS